MALSRLKFLSYNGYYNRRHKYEGDLATDYSGIYIPSYYYPNEVSFNPGNNVDTYGIEAVNWTNDWRPDYLLVYHKDNQNREVIDSRWYITSWDRTKTKQWKMSLHRDVVTDYYDSILAVPMYVERAILKDNDPFVFNPEGIGVNQIKQSETLLKDDSGIAWIVGYVSRNDKESSSPVYGQPLSLDTAVIPDIIEPTFSQWEYYNYFNARDNYKELDDASIRIENKYNGSNVYAIWNYDSDKWFAYNSNGTINNTLTNKFDLYAQSYTIKSLVTSTITNSGRIIGSETYDEVVSYNNKIIHTTSDNIYRKLTTTPISNSYLLNNPSTLISQISSLCDEVYSDIDNLTIKPLNVYTTGGVSCYYESVSAGEYGVTFPSSINRDHLKDAPYDMWVIPYPIRGNITIENNAVDSWTNQTYSGLDALNMSQSLAAKLGSNLFDLQILPYCPMTGFNYTKDASGNTTKVDINTTSTSRRTIIFKDPSGTNTPYMTILWSTSSSGSVYIPLEINTTNKKMDSITEVYRLVSPNYSTNYEFDIAKNNGINGFYAYYTYMPYSPFLQINPVYNGLYGQSFEDTRGLSLKGDFSISYTTDPWTNYQIQNKNYSEIFDRQLDNMDINHKYDKISGWANVLAGSLGAATGGAAMGMMVGAPAGGAISGTLLSAAGGVTDMLLNEKRYKEQKSFAVDNFEMQCDNIKALPQSLAKTTAYSIINKVFPILEHYTCTNEEKIAIANKIKYNSMSVGRIGTIEDFIHNSFDYDGILDEGFIRGKVIQIPNGSEFNKYGTSFEENYEVLLSIADELEKGVYFK